MATKKIALRVRNPWGDLQVNDLIDDPDEVKKVLAGPHENDVLRVPAEPDEQEPEEKQAHRRGSRRD